MDHRRVLPGPFPEGEGLHLAVQPDQTTPELEFIQMVQPFLNGVEFRHNGRIGEFPLFHPLFPVGNAFVLVGRGNGLVDEFRVVLQELVVVVLLSVELPAAEAGQAGPLVHIVPVVPVRSEGVHLGQVFLEPFDGMLVDPVHFERFPFEILLQGADHFWQVFVDPAEGGQHESGAVDGDLDDETAVADGPVAVILLPPDKDGPETAFRGMVVLFGKVIIEYRLVVDADMLEF